LKVGGVFGPFTSATVGYKVTANEDGSINVTASEEKYTGVTMVGNLTLGTYTVKNLAYDKATNSFSRDYSEDGIKVHFKTNGGSMKKDEDYAFGKISKMTVTLAEDGTLTITNNYKIGAMPFPISATYTGVNSLLMPPVGRTGIMLTLTLYRCISSGKTLQDCLRHRRTSRIMPSQQV